MELARFTIRLLWLLVKMLYSLGRMLDRPDCPSRNAAQNQLWKQTTREIYSHFLNSPNVSRGTVLELLLWFIYAVYIVPRLMCLFKSSPFALFAMYNFKKSHVQKTFSRLHKLSALLILCGCVIKLMSGCALWALYNTYRQESNCSSRLISKCTTKIAISACSIHHVYVTKQQKAQIITHLFISPLVKEVYCFVCWIN